MQVSQDSRLIVEETTVASLNNILDVSLPTCVCRSGEHSCVSCRGPLARGRRISKRRAKAQVISLAWRVRPMQISHFLCPDQNRVQIRGTFCNLFFPPGSHKEANVHRMFDINPLVASDKLAMTAAGDALSLLQLGMSGSDRGLLLEAHRRYGIAIARLRSELADAGSDPPTSDMTIAVYLLTACEVYHSTDFASEHWASHELALLKLLLAAKSLTGDFESAASRFLQWRYVGMPMYALSYGLMQKRSVLFDRPRWSNALGKRRFPLTVIVMHVPGCLERLEAARTKPDNFSELSTAVDQAWDLRVEMHNCMMESSMVAIDPPYYPADLAEYTAFKEAVGDLDSLYPEVLRFHDLPAGQHARIFWTSLLVLDGTLLGLSESETTALDRDTNHNIGGLEFEVETCVDKLCQSLPYFTSLEAGTVGSLSAFETIHHLQQHFCKQSLAKHAEWCRRVKERFVPGYRIARVMARD